MEKELNAIVLTKNSTSEEIKNYFKAILKLSESDEDFPVNLDDVWMLVYSNRSNAVSSLKKNFIEDIDYKKTSPNNISLLQNNERIWGGQNKIDYHLSTSCLEYFIARKVRPVFEVYRKVFHKTIENSIGVDVKMRAAMWACDFLHLNDTSRLLMARSILEPLGLPVPDYVQSKGVHHSAQELLRKNNVAISSQAFNKLALAEGYLEKKSRKTRKGEKFFYTISDKGLPFGENLISEHNPNETQPHWYDDRFSELLNIIGVRTPALF